MRIARVVGYAVSCLLCLILFPAAFRGVTPSEPDRRSFEPGGPETMVRVGDASRSKLLDAGRTDTGGFSFSMKQLYGFTLFLDEQGARQALEPLKGEPLDSLLEKEKIQQVVIEGDFPKLVLLKFDYKVSGREVREDLAEALGRGIPEAGKFLNNLRRDFGPGDEVVVRIAGGERVLTNVAGKDMPEIQSRGLARALMKAWMSKKIVSDIAPLMK